MDPATAQLATTATEGAGPVAPRARLPGLGPGSAQLARAPFAGKAGRIPGEPADLLPDAGGVGAGGAAAAVELRTGSRPGDRRKPTAPFPVLTALRAGVREAYAPAVITGTAGSHAREGDPVPS
ncbi:hypothetical protein GCM10022222_24540 [Amycolatopsis ultiminotia]|uniref:Uncharacterized protein n=1 Tax=Amycolatopsis ultiminotia TaxID=543629 RepID=A0ABP6VUH3_9PSEU